jgi:ribosomal protein S18 acetylase RimI-like enzyme
MLASLSPSPRSAFRAFLASDAGEPIAVASLYLAAGVAGIYNVATLPAARRRGIGTHLTDATLRAARSAGYRVAVLQATPEAIGVYRRLGFRPYCRLQSYAWAEDG